MKRTLCFLLLCAILLCSCTKRVSAREKMESFADAYGKVGSVYAATAQEGEDGYMDDAFFLSLFGAKPTGLADCAVFLGEDLNGAEECGALVADSMGDALLLYDVAWERIGLLLSLEKQEGRNPAYVLTQYGKTVVYGVFSEKDKAEKIIETLF